jgi:hypothetical protein
MGAARLVRGSEARGFSGPAGLPVRPLRRVSRTYSKGIRVDRPEDVAPAWQAALAADRPCVLEAVTDPEVPPPPPHITLEQGKSLLSAILKGDPARAEVIQQSWKQVVKTWLKA